MSGFARDEVRDFYSLYALSGPTPLTPLPKRKGGTRIGFARDSVRDS